MVPGGSTAVPCSGPETIDKVAGSGLPLIPDKTSTTTLDPVVTLAARFLMPGACGKVIRPILALSRCANQMLPSGPTVIAFYVVVRYWRKLCNHAARGNAANQIIATVRIPDFAIRPFCMLAITASPCSRSYMVVTPLVVILAIF